MEDDEDGQNDDDDAASAPGEMALTVCINAKGNLCDDVSMLALTSRLVFCEIWNQIYPHQAATRYKATIRNLNFFSFYRFCQMLGRPSSKTCSVTGSLVDMEFDTVFHKKDMTLHANTFYYVKRLVELHWLQGFPLWDVVTGLSTNEGNPRNPLTDFMYSILQIVALWRVDHDQWKFKATDYLPDAKRSRMPNSV